MADRVANDLEEQNARKQIAVACRMMLQGELSFFEGAQRVLALRRLLGGVEHLDPDFVPFVAIDSETDHLPTEESRNLWSAAALDRLAPEFEDVEEWASGVALPACQRIIERFDPDAS